VAVQRSSAEPELRVRKVDSRTIDGETIVLDLVTERYLRLNATGTVLWERLVNSTTRSTLVATLIEKFRLDDESAAADVDAFVAELRQHGLLDEPTA
jgi:hypothetical protein